MEEEELMDEERHEEEVAQEEPQVYTVKKDLTGWRFDRRTFLTAAGATAAVAAVGTVASCGEATPPEEVVVVEVIATPSHTPPSIEIEVEGPSPQATEAPEPTEAAAPTEASEPSATPRPTTEPSPTHTSTPETPQAEFVKDVTIPDGTEMKPNQPFKKTWRYRNSGSVPWGEGVRLVFVEGTIQGYRSNKMGGPDFVNVPNVAPGDTVDVSVDLIAPAQEGRYRSYWRLKLPNGEWLENNHYAEIVVKIPVTPTWTPTVCACDGVCECEGHCGEHTQPRPTRVKHYWHPN
jgi:hypothetical protein